MFAEIKYAWRGVTANAASNLLVMGVLGVAVGTTVALLVTVDRAVLRPITNIEDSHRIVFLSGLTAPPQTDVVGWWRHAQSFERMGSFSPGEARVGPHGESSVRLVEVSAGFYEVLRVRPSTGRLFQDSDEHQVEGRVAVVSEAYGNAYFGRTPSVLGSSITLNGVPHSIVGVLPERHVFPFGAQVWVPRSRTSSSVLAGGVAGPQVQEETRYIARLAPQYTIETARAELLLMLKRLNDEYGPKSGMRFGDTVGINNARDALTRDINPIIVNLFGITCIVLLIAITNCSSIMLGVAIRRRTEWAVSEALGATPLHLGKQVALEALLLAIGTGVIGFSVSHLSFEAIRALIPPRFSYLSEVNRYALAVSGVAAFSLACVVVLLTVVPAIRSALGTDAASLLREGGSGSGGRLHRRTRQAIACFQLSATVALVMLADLSLRSYLQMTAVEYGFNPSELTVAKGFVTRVPEDKKSYGLRVEAMLQSLRGAGTENAAASSSMPLIEPSRYVFVKTSDRPIGSRYQAVSPNYFRVMGIPSIVGAPFQSNDEHVAVISRTLASRLGLSGNSLHASDTLMLDGEQSPRRIVGVVGDTAWDAYHGGDEPHIYLPLRDPYRGRIPPELWIVGGESNSPESLSLALRATLHDETSRASIRIWKLEEVIRESVRPARMRTVLFWIYGALGAMLAMTGVYGLVALVSLLRRREIGIHMVCGASLWQVVSKVAGETLLLCFGSLAIGSGVFWVAAGTLGSLFYGVRPADLDSLITAVAVVLIPAMGVAVIPAIRLARLSPREALQGGNT
ncbi:MAG TPA: ABC transporter permease [Bryobacteraceae bacterium]|nr:ABC transporter permease [Bryobacteraceae bacterium]